MSAGDCERLGTKQFSGVGEWVCARIEEWVPACWKIAGVVGVCKQMELKNFSTLAVRKEDTKRVSLLCAWLL